MALPYDLSYAVVLAAPPHDGTPLYGQVKRCTRGGVLENYLIEHDLALQGQKVPESAIVMDANVQARVLVAFDTPAALYHACTNQLDCLAALRDLVLANMPVRAVYGDREITALRRTIVGGTLHYVPFSSVRPFFPPAEQSASFSSLATLKLYVAPPPGAAALVASPVEKKRTLQRAEYIDTHGRVRYKTLYRIGRPIDVTIKWLAQGCGHAGMRNAPWPLSLSNKMVLFDPAYWPALIVKMGLEKFLEDLHRDLSAQFKSLLDVELTFSTPTPTEAKDPKKNDTKHPIVTMTLNDIVADMRTIGMLVTAEGTRWSDFSAALLAREHCMYKLLSRIKLGLQHPGSITSCTPPWYYREIKGPNSLGKGEVPDGLEIVEELDEDFEP